MARLILLVLFVVALIIAITSVMALFDDVDTATRKSDAGKKDQTMPATIRKVSYVLLIIVMFGVTSGWLGAA